MAGRDSPGKRGKAGGNNGAVCVAGDFKFSNNAVVVLLRYYTKHKLQVGICSSGPDVCAGFPLVYTASSDVWVFVFGAAPNCAGKVPARGELAIVDIAGAVSSVGEHARVVHCRDRMSGGLSGLRVEIIPAWKCGGDCLEHETARAAGVGAVGFAGGIADHTVWNAVGGLSV